MFFFFFSSRRRHTRCSRDWSSDVCSSDLGADDERVEGVARVEAVGRPAARPGRQWRGGGGGRGLLPRFLPDDRDPRLAAEDRKSGVEGKRGDLGGRRIIKKKKKKNEGRQV